MPPVPLPAPASSWGTRVLSHVGGAPTVKKIGADAGVAALFALGGYLTRDDGPLKDASPSTKKIVNAVFGVPMFAKLTGPQLVEKWKEREVPDFVMHGLTAAIATLGITANDHELITSAAMLATLFAMAGHLEDGVQGKSKEGIEALEKMIPEEARRYARAGEAYVLNADGSHKIETIKAEDIQVGDHIALKPGELAAVDGQVLYVHGGDHKPIEKGFLKANVLQSGEVSGMEMVTSSSPVQQCTQIADHSHIVMEAKKVRGESETAHMVKTLEAAENNPSRSEHMLKNGISKIYVPAMLAACAAQFALTYYTDHKKHKTPLSKKEAEEEKHRVTHPLEKSVKRTAELAIKMAPCAIMASTLVIPFVKNALMASHGVAINENVALEKMQKITHVFCDIRGTLTSGKGTIFKGLHLWEGGTLVATTEKSILGKLADAQHGNNHEIAESLRRAAAKAGHIVDGARATQLPNISKGVISHFADGETVHMGAADMFQATEHKIPAELLEATLKHDADVTYFRHFDGKTERWGIAGFEDTLRAGTKEAVEKLLKSGKKITLVTGMPEQSAQRIRRQLIPAGMSEDAIGLHANCAQHAQNGLGKIGKDQVVAPFLGDKKNVVAYFGDQMNDSIVMENVKKAGGISFAVRSTAPITTKNLSSAVVEGIHQLPDLMVLSKRLNHALWLNVGAAASWMTLLVGSHVFGHHMKTQNASIAHEAPTFLLTLAGLAQSIRMVKGLGAIAR